MAVEETVGLDDRNRRQRVVLNVRIKIGDVLVVRAQGRIRHDLRRIQERIADVAERARFASPPSAVQSLAVVLPGDMVLGEQQADVVLRVLGGIVNWSGPERRGRAITQVARVVVVDQVVGILRAVAGLERACRKRVEISHYRLRRPAAWCRRSSRKIRRYPDRRSVLP